MRNWLKILAEGARIWQAVYGGAVTIGPSSRIMSLPWGVRTFSIHRDLILLSGAPTCFWHRPTNFTNSNQKYLYLMPRPSPALTSFKERYKTDTTKITIRDKNFSFFVPESLDMIIDQENLFHNFPLWTKIWEASVILADYLVGLAVEPQKRFLEIGCGLGHVGIVASSFGHRVTMTDYNQDALSFAGANALLNNLPGLEIKELDWNRPQIKGAFDYIVGSEITYQENNFQPLLNLFKTYLKDEGEIFIANGIRKTSMEFIKRMSDMFHIEGHKKKLRSQDREISIILCKMKFKR